LDNASGVGCKSEHLSLGAITKSDAVRETIQTSFEGTGIGDDGKKT